MASKSNGRGPAVKSDGGAPRKLVTTTHGSRNLKAVPPTHASHIGRSVGNHADGKDLKRPPTPGPQAKRDFVPLGNEVAKNVGRGSPGAGRVVSPAGTQGCHSGTGAAIGTKMLPQGGK
jgi:hypothetical protein